MIVPPADRALLTNQLEQLAQAVEELLSSGLTTAGPATRETLDVTFREASRLRLLRVASTLRAANEEIGRYIAKQPEFSARRLAFFLNRSWLLARGLLSALAQNDDVAWDRLLWSPTTEPVDSVTVVTLGVAKKIARGAFCAFEFRLRTVASEESGEQSPREIPSRLVWSCIFPMKPGTDIPAEGFLQLPQKQKFKAATFLDGRQLTLTNALIARDAWDGGRMTLTENSTLTAGESFRDWEPFTSWSAEPLLQRIRQHETSPFDLEVELQDEVVLHDWSIQRKRAEQQDGQIVFPITCGSLEFAAVVSAGADGQSQAKRLTEMVKQKTRPPLFGLLHFDRCRLVLQPLALINNDGPEHITISKDKIDKAALLKTLKF